MRFVVPWNLACSILFATFLAQAADGPPSITTQPAGQMVLAGTPVTFSVVADGTAPLTYQWRRNGTEIIGATSSSYLIPAAAIGDDNTQFSVVVSNALNTATSANALLRVETGMLVVGATTNLVNISTHNWRYLTTGIDQGLTWTNNSFPDSGWSLGAALFGVEAAGVYAEPFRSVFSPYNAAITTYYFRTHFTYSPTGNVAGVLLTVTANIDDGAAFYLNGAEIGRVRLNPGQTYASLATGDNEGGTETFTFNATGVIVPGDNVLAVEVHQQSAASTDLVYGMNLNATTTNRVPDTVKPVLVTTTPNPGITVISLNEIEVFFSEEVQGVDATDLLINSQPAASVLHGGVGQYRFNFTQPATGLVQVAFISNPGITDLAFNPNTFTSTSWTYTLDPNAAGGDVRINEFMADNQTGIHDQDGDNSDWLELYNASAILVDLSGWFLTDDPFVPTKWRIPNGTSILPIGHLLVWASEKNRTNPVAPLHTNFKLDPDGEFLGLYSPLTNLVSAFSPVYPPQRPDVSYGRDPQDPSSVGYYSKPSPGANNPAGGNTNDFAPDIVFSRPSGTFFSSFNASLSLSTPAANAVIRYTLITNLPYANLNSVLTNVPTASSPAYALPFAVPHTMQIRARAFQPGKLPGTPITVTYVQLAENVRSWSSDLPVCIIHTLGATNTTAGANGISLAGDQAAVFMTFDNDCGRSSLTNHPNLTRRAGINARGSSTGGFAKSNFAVELWDEFNEDTDAEVFGMPSESDWVLYGINGFDPGLMHNAIFHWFGRQLNNQTASRTRYVEVYRKIGLGAITTNDYFGLYLLEEKPKRNKNRLDIEPLELEETNAPAITGGYMLRIDRTDTNERFWNPPQIGSIRPTPASIIIDYPNTPFNSPDPRAHLQSNYIRSYIQAFITNLDSVSYTNTVTGYHQFIDADQWVDNLIGNIICFNVDGYRLSGYFHKDLNQRLRQGPYWDCDRCLGTGGAGGATPQGDNRCFSPFFWRLPAFDVGTDNGTDFFGVSNVGVSWFSRLYRDPDFWQRFIDRYQMHRTNVYSTNAIYAMVDDLHNQIREAQQREVRRWANPPTGVFNYPRSGNHTVNSYNFNFGGIVGPGSAGAFSNEVNFQKKWLGDRLLFMDTNFLAMPTLSRGTELVASGTTATVTPAAKAGSQLLYTLDGTDPRLPGGAVSPAALVSAGPVTLTITSNVRLFARSYNTSHANLTNTVNEVGKPLINSFWSGPVAATYYTALPPLRITEIMYHPAPPPIGNTNDPDNFEYIEVRNTSGSDLNVGGFRVRGGVDFDFPAVTLSAGQSGVIAKNAAAFQSRYGLAPLVLGSYSNNLANDGDHLVLQGPLREPILDFNFSDGWYPITDGFGFSLQIVSDALPITAWGTNTSWRPSGALNGTPGSVDPGPAAIPTVYINEILTHTDLPAVDAIELFNPNGTAVNVGGWFLTDDVGSPKKYRLPNPTMIGANSHLALYADTSFGAVFNLSSKGDEVYLYSGDPVTTDLTGFRHGFDFGAQFNGVTFGRYGTSSGNDQYPAQSVPTLGSANAGPKVGPVVITEIMYRPPDITTSEGPRDNDKDEYVELANLGPAAQPLYDTNFPANTWKLRDAVDFTFPPGILLLAGERVLLVSFDPTDPTVATRFRTLHQLPFQTRLFGPYEGKLDNSGDSIELVRPDLPQPISAPDAGAVYYVLADKVNYSDALPWPTNADGTGLSIHRIVPGDYGNDATNWIAAATSAGNGAPILGGPVFTLQPQSQVVLGTLNATFNAVAMGAPPVTYQWYFNDFEISGATSSNYSIAYLDSSHDGVYQCRAFNPDGATLSSAATLHVVVPASITLNPTNVSLRVPPDPQALANRSVTFRIGASSSNPPLTFQWQLNGTNLPSGHPNFLGVTTTNLVVTNVLVEHGGIYRCAVTDQAGTVYSLEAVLSTLVSPQFILQPQSQTIFYGDPVTLTVAVSNACTGPFNYVWRYQSAIIASNFMVSAYFSSITITNVILQVSNLNRYRCDVQSPATVGQGTASGNALITVLVDADHDRVPDFWELQYGLSTNNAADAFLDLDGDLMSNLNEYNAGTDPTDPQSVLRVTDFLLTPAESTFSFLAISNRTYSVQAAGALPGPWLSVTNLSAAPSNRTVVVIDTPVLPPPRYIRVVTP